MSDAPRILKTAQRAVFESPDGKVLIGADLRPVHPAEAALAWIAFTALDQPECHLIDGVYIVTDCDGEERGRGPSEEMAIASAIKWAVESAQAGEREARQTIYRFRKAFAALIGDAT